MCRGMCVWLRDAAGIRGMGACPVMHVWYHKPVGNPPCVARVKEPAVASVWPHLSREERSSTWWRSRTAGRVTALHGQSTQKGAGSQAATVCSSNSGDQRRHNLVIRHNNGFIQQRAQGPRAGRIRRGVGKHLVRRQRQWCRHHATCKRTHKPPPAVPLQRWSAAGRRCFPL